MSATAGTGAAQTDATRVGSTARIGINDAEDAAMRDIASADIRLRKLILLESAMRGVVDMTASSERDRLILGGDDDGLDGDLHDDDDGDGECDDVRLEGQDARGVGHGALGHPRRDTVEEHPLEENTGRVIGWEARMAWVLDSQAIMEVIECVENAAVAKVETRTIGNARDRPRVSGTTLGKNENSARSFGVKTRAQGWSRRSINDSNDEGEGAWSQNEGKYQGENGEKEHPSSPISAPFPTSLALWIDFMNRSGFRQPSSTEYQILMKRAGKRIHKQLARLCKFYYDARLVEDDAKVDNPPAVDCHSESGRQSQAALMEGLPERVRLDIADTHRIWSAVSQARDSLFIDLKAIASSCIACLEQLYKIQFVIKAGVDADRRRTHATFLLSVISNLSRKLQCLDLQLRFDMFSGGPITTSGDDFAVGFFSEHLEARAGQAQLAQSEAQQRLDKARARAREYAAAGPEFGRVAAAYARVHREVEVAEDDLRRMEGGVGFTRGGGGGGSWD
ncbi:hypothetical protein DFJ73DRAFT_501832 [Zopfochytrium polystomum]|nr:hypothetical protein DFJ73DRAFT_501832 [Zopfochytrium polystomum]